MKRFTTRLQLCIHSLRLNGARWLFGLSLLMLGADLSANVNLTYSDAAGTATLDGSFSYTCTSDFSSFGSTDFYAGGFILDSSFFQSITSLTSGSISFSIAGTTRTAQSNPVFINSSGVGGNTLGANFTPSSPLVSTGESVSVTWSNATFSVANPSSVFKTGTSSFGSANCLLTASPGTITVSGTAATPSNHPTGFSATANSSADISTTWTDASAGDLPLNYLVLCATSNSFSNPVDGTAQADDTNCADGSGVQNIAQGTQTAAWTGLTGSTQYFFKIFPSRGSSTDIVYKTDGSVQTSDATTSAGNPAENDNTNEITEPTEDPTGGSASSDSNSITITWSDTNESPNYVMYCNTTGSFTSPTDGVPVSVDSDCGDGSGVQILEQNSAASQAKQNSSPLNQAKASQSNSNLSIAWPSLSAETTYYFKLFPYNGTDSAENYKVDGTPLEINATTSQGDSANVSSFGGTETTPTIYKVTVSKIEFKNAQGEFVTLAEEGSSFDVASVGANSAVGNFGKTAVLPNGSYSHIRITLDSTFGLRFSGSDNSASCRTTSGGSTGSVSTSLSNVAIGSTDGGTATEQQITYPSGTTADSLLSAAGVSTAGESFQITKAAAFTVTDTSLPPSIGINIDVADSVEVLNSLGTCFVIPKPPVVNVSVGN